MKQKAVLFTNLLLALSLAIFPVNAQKKKTRITPKKTPVVRVLAENPFEPPMPEIKDFAFVINIDKNSGVTMKIQKTESTDVLTTASDAKTLKEFFSGVSNPKSSLAPILIVKADSSLNFSDVINVIKASRTSSIKKAKVKISKDFYAFVLPMPDRNYKMKPTPLMLFTELDKNMNLNINGEPLGSLNDTSQLTNFLTEIFKAREDNGILREGTNLVETTVLIKAPPTAKFSDVIKLATVLRETGSTMVGLVVDDFNPLQNIIIETYRLEP